MKLRLLITVISVCTLAITGCTVEGHVVDSSPADVVYERPVAPAPDYIWIEGDWVWSGGAYTWRNGYWSMPHRGRGWNSGHWH